MQAFQVALPLSGKALEQERSKVTKVKLEKHIF